VDCRELSCRLLNAIDSARRLWLHAPMRTRPEETLGEIAVEAEQLIAGETATCPNEFQINAVALESPTLLRTAAVDVVDTKEGGVRNTAALAARTIDFEDLDPEEAPIPSLSLTTILGISLVLPPQAQNTVLVAARLTPRRSVARPRPFSECAQRLRGSAVRTVLFGHAGI
jgi:hypothetical protein